MRSYVLVIFNLLAPRARTAMLLFIHLGECSRPNIVDVSYAHYTCTVASTQAEACSLVVFHVALNFKYSLTLGTEIGSSVRQASGKNQLEHSITKGGGELDLFHFTAIIIIRGLKVFPVERLRTHYTCGGKTTRLYRSRYGVIEE